MRRFAALLAAVAALAVAVPPSAAHAGGHGGHGDHVEYAPPVAGPVVDPFREPPGPYGPGNRGLDFATGPGQAVLAAAAGEVTFAGQVGASLHVVVLHADGLRTSYSFLQSVAVRRGDHVGRGTAVGTAGPLLHFGARAGDVYVDPATLFAPGPPAVHLVPVEQRVPGSVDDERRGLLGALRAAGRLVAGAAGATVDGVEWARDASVAAASKTVDALAEHLDEQLEVWALRLAVLGHYLHTLQPHQLALTAFSAFRAWRSTECTSGSFAVPRRRGRRILVMVGGLGSAGRNADVLHVDAGALGYDTTDVAQFSYRGGRAPGVGDLGGVPVRDYDSTDSQGDLDAAGRRLAELLDDIARAHPGVPVDVVAHSQGGIVARLALAGGSPTPVEHLVTLGSPHQGADLATAVALVGATGTGRLLLGAASGATDLDPGAPAIAQLAETSPLMARLKRTELPETTVVTSIAASGDLVVAGDRTVLDGAGNVLVPMVGPFAHGELPGSAGGRREVALALAGLPPGCRPLWEVARDTVVATAISHTQDALGAGIGGGLLYADVRMPAGPPVSVAAGVAGR